MPLIFKIAEPSRRNTSEALRYHLFCGFTCRMVFIGEPGPQR